MAQTKNLTEEAAADAGAADGGPPAGYRDALLVEQRGYEEKLAAAEAAGDDKSAGQWKSHVDGVVAELKRIGADAKPSSRRAETR